MVDEALITAGSRDRGGSYIEAGGGAVLWDALHGWRSVPQVVWNFSVGGFQVLPKWLGYRHSHRGHAALSVEDRALFTEICQRIQALVDLEAACDHVFEAARASPLEAR
jgi:hypothetical protein